MRARAAAEAGRARGGRSPRGPFYVYGAPMRMGALPRSGGMLRAGSFCVRGRRFLHAGPFRAWRASCARNLYTFRGNSAHAALFRVLGRISLE